jgi:hypothetical protein
MGSVFGGSQMNAVRKKYLYQLNTDADVVQLKPKSELPPALRSIVTLVIQVVVASGLASPADRKFPPCLRFLTRHWRQFRSHIMLHRIGTFRISRTHNGAMVRDADKFDNWGSKYFDDMRAAKAWAHLAQLQKAARVFHPKPILSFA